MNLLFHFRVKFFVFGKIVYGIIKNLNSLSLSISSDNSSELLNNYDYYFNNYNKFQLSFSETSLIVTKSVNNQTFDK